LTEGLQPQPVYSPGCVASLRTSEVFPLEEARDAIVGWAGDDLITARLGVTVLVTRSWSPLRSVGVEEGGGELTVAQVEANCGVVPVERSAAESGGGPGLAVLARRTTAEPARSVFGECIVLHEIAPLKERRLAPPLAPTEDITRSMRAALMRYADDPPPPVLTGHMPDGRRLEQPHVAFLAPPANVCAPAGHGVAIDGLSGAVGAVAVVLPRGTAALDRAAIVCALERWERAGFRLLLGRAGVMQLARADTALSQAWRGPSRRWASVTPVALERNPGDLTARDPGKAAAAVRHAEETVARGCTHIGLPRPTRVRVMPRSSFPAAPPASAFAPYPRNGNGFKRVCVHVELEFAEPVQGPVVLGVGRYFGVGLCGALLRGSNGQDGL